MSCRHITSTDEADVGEYGQNPLNGILRLLLIVGLVLRGVIAALFMVTMVADLLWFVGFQFFRRATAR